MSPSRDAEDVRAATAAIRAELRKLRASLARIEATVDALPSAPRRRRGEGRPRPERYYRVLVSVYERGGRHGIGTEELGGIGSENGYDRRGLGGFFAGAQAPLRLVDGCAQLTPEGLALVDGYLSEVAG